MKPALSQVRQRPPGVQISPALGSLAIVVSRSYGWVRTAGAWLATPVGVIALWLFGEWFFSTRPGIVVGLIVGPLLLLVLALGIASLFYVFRK